MEGFSSKLWLTFSVHFNACVGCRQSLSETITKGKGEQTLSGQACPGVPASEGDRRSWMFPPSHVSWGKIKKSRRVVLQTLHFSRGKGVIPHPCSALLLPAEPPPGDPSRDGGHGARARGAAFPWWGGG